MIAAVLAVVAFVATFAVVAVVRRVAERLGVIDVPNERSSHARPTARGGGLGMVVVSLALIGIAGIMRGGITADDALLMAAAAAIAAVGLADDMYSLSAVARLAVQCIIALVVVAWLDVPAIVTGNGDPGGLLVVLLQGAGVVWIVGIINAYNFMDGIDGLAGLHALIAATLWAVMAHIAGLSDALAVAAIVAGTAAGFLLHNWAPARIFMGDVGSGYLGFVFAVLPLWVPGNVNLRLVGVLVMWPFIFDTLFTLVRRLLRGENLFRAHRTHLYQRLLATGLSHSQVTQIYAVHAFASGAVGGAVAWLSMPWWVAVGTLGVLAGSSWQLVRLREQRSVLQKPVI